MAAVVSVFEKASAAIASDRDDLALLRVAEDLPDFLANDIPNPVVEGERLGQGWSPEERDDFVAKAKVLAERLEDALMKTSERTVAFEALHEQFGGRIPDDLMLYVPDAGLETKSSFNDSSDKTVAPITMPLISSGLLVAISESIMFMRKRQADTASAVLAINCNVSEIR